MGEDLIQHVREAPHPLTSGQYHPENVIYELVSLVSEIDLRFHSYLFFQLLPHTLGLFHQITTAHLLYPLNSVFIHLEQLHRYPPWRVPFERLTVLYVLFQPYYVSLCAPIPYAHVSVLLMSGCLLIYRIPELIEPDILWSHHGNDGHLQYLPQPLYVYLHSLPLGLVHHVQGEDNVGSRFQ